MRKVVTAVRDGAAAASYTASEDGKAKTQSAVVVHSPNSRIGVNVLVKRKQLRQDTAKQMAAAMSFHKEYHEMITRCKRPYKKRYQLDEQDVDRLFDMIPRTRKVTRAVVTKKISQSSIAEWFGVSPFALQAAIYRSKQACQGKTLPFKHKTILTSWERQLLCQKLYAACDQFQSPGKAELEDWIRSMIEKRREEEGEGALNKHEISLINGDQGLSRTTWNTLLREMDVVCSTGKPISEARVRDFTDYNSAKSLFQLAQAMESAGITKKGKLLHPERVFNMDETVALKGMCYGLRNISTRKERRHEHIGTEKYQRATLAAVVSLDGQRHPPLLITPKANHPKQPGVRIDDESTLTEAVVGGGADGQKLPYFHAVSETGCINSTIFARFLRSLRRHVGHDEQIVLYSDGHASRTVTNMSEIAAKFNIRLVLMHPNCTHGLQPCDKLFHVYHQELAAVQEVARQASRDLLKQLDCTDESLNSNQLQVRRKAIVFPVLAYYQFNANITKAWRECGIDAIAQEAEAMQVAFDVTAISPMPRHTGVSFHPSDFDEFEDGQYIFEAHVFKTIKQMPRVQLMIKAKKKSTSYPVTELLTLAKSVIATDTDHIDAKCISSGLFLLERLIERLEKEQEQEEKQQRKRLASGELTRRLFDFHDERQATIAAKAAKDAETPRPKEIEALEYVCAWAQLNNIDEVMMHHLRRFLKSNGIQTQGISKVGLLNMIYRLYCTSDDNMSAAAADHTYTSDDGAASAPTAEEAAAVTAKATTKEPKKRPPRKTKASSKRPKATAAPASSTENSPPPATPARQPTTAELEPNAACQAPQTPRPPSVAMSQTLPYQLSAAPQTIPFPLPTPVPFSPAMLGAGCFPMNSYPLSTSTPAPPPPPTSIPLPLVSQSQLFSQMAAQALMKQPTTTSRQPLGTIQNTHMNSSTFQL